MKAFAISIAILIASTGCDGNTRLNGKVVDADNKPVPGAEVELAQLPNKERHSRTVTSAEGAYVVAFTHAPRNISLVFTVNKDGYKPYRKEFTVSEREHFPKEIALELAPPDSTPEK